MAIPDSCQGPYPYIVSRLHVVVQLSAKSNLRNNSIAIIHDLYGLLGGARFLRIVLDKTKKPGTTYVVPGSPLGIL